MDEQLYLNIYIKLTHYIYISKRMGDMTVTTKNDTNASNPNISFNDKYSKYKLSHSLEINIQQIKEIFYKDNTLTETEFMNQDSTLKCAVIFIEGMADREVISKSIIAPITRNNPPKDIDGNIDYLMHQVINSNDTKKTKEVIDIINAIVVGKTVLFLEHAKEALIINTIGWKTRSIEEPENEKVLRGPREGFTEALITNLSLIRRKLLTPDLKFEYIELGMRSGTKICICYLDSIVNPKILDELYSRLNSINIDGVIASGYIQELVRDAPLSPFKTLGSTERPDIIAAKLLEGRIAVLIEGTPVVITLPHIFIEYFQANEDYYINFYFSSINRILRILSFIISISVPSIYVALVTFHQELIPTHLAVSIAAAKEGIPFPTIVEALGLLTIFEILRETGTRMPSYIGQALSIVGALVIGQAAVEARFVSSPIVIIVALSAITGLMIPRAKGAVILVRTLFLLCSSVLGLYGVVFGAAGLMLHLFELRSFGVPYMLGLMTIQAQDIKDTIIRAPWWYMEYRPKFIATDSKRKGTATKKQ